MGFIIPSLRQSLWTGGGNYMTAVIPKTPAPKTRHKLDYRTKITAVCIIDRTNQPRPHSHVHPSHAHTSAADSVRPRLLYTPTCPTQPRASNKQAHSSTQKIPHTRFKLKVSLTRLKQQYITTSSVARIFSPPPPKINTYETKQHALNQPSVRRQTRFDGNTLPTIKNNHKK